MGRVNQWKKELSANFDEKVMNKVRAREKIHQKYDDYWLVEEYLKKYRTYEGIEKMKKIYKRNKLCVGGFFEN